VHYETTCVFHEDRDNIRDRNKYLFNVQEQHICLRAAEHVTALQRDVQKRIELT